MNAVHKGLESKSFTKFSPIVEQHAYCTATGLLASDKCPSKAMGWYSKENLPGHCTSCTGAAPTEPNSAAAPSDQQNPTPATTTAPATNPEQAAPTTSPTENQTAA